MDKSYIKQIEEEKKRHAEKMEELDRAAGISKLLPAGYQNPRSILFADKAQPWVSYKVNTLEEALAIVNAYPVPYEVSALQATFLSIQPVGFHKPDYKDAKVRWIAERAILVRQHGGRGFYTATVTFWCYLAGLQQAQVQVNIDVERFPWRLRSRMKARYDIYGNVEHAEYFEGDLPKYGPQGLTKYGGGSRDAFDVRYAFTKEAFAKLVEAVSQKEAI